MVHKDCFLNAVEPFTTFGDVPVGDKAYQAYEKYVDEDVFSKEEYIEYRSNIVIHRFAYAFIDKISPFSNKITFMYLEIITALMTALIISYILKWIAKITNLITGCFLLVFLAFFAPNLMMAGKCQRRINFVIKRRLKNAC